MDSIYASSLICSSEASLLFRRLPSKGNSQGNLEAKIDEAVAVEGEDFKKWEELMAVKVEDKHRVRGGYLGSKWRKRKKMRSSKGFIECLILEILRSASNKHLSLRPISTY